MVTQMAFCNRCRRRNRQVFFARVGAGPESAEFLVNRVITQNTINPNSPPICRTFQTNGDTMIPGAARASAKGNNMPTASIPREIWENIRHCLAKSVIGKLSDCWTNGMQQATGNTTSGRRLQAVYSELTDSDETSAGVPASGTVPIIRELPFPDSSISTFSRTCIASARTVANSRNHSM